MIEICDICGKDITISNLGHKVTFSPALDNGCEEITVCDKCMKQIQQFARRISK